MFAHNALNCQSPNRKPHTPFAHNKRNSQFADKAINSQSRYIKPHAPLANTEPNDGVPSLGYVRANVVGYH